MSSLQSERQIQIDTEEKINILEEEKKALKNDMDILRTKHSVEDLSEHPLYLEYQKNLAAKEGRLEILEAKRERLASFAATTTHKGKLFGSHP